MSYVTERQTDQQYHTKRRNVVGEMYLSICVASVVDHYGSST